MKVAKLPSNSLVGNSNQNETYDEYDTYSPNNEFNSSKYNYPNSIELMNSNISNHYEVPNMSSMLYEFTNKESDHIHQAFRVGNFVSLRDLPNVLLPGNVIIGQTSKMEENLYSVIERKSYVELSNHGGYFSKFEWKPEPYADFKDKLKNARLKH